MAGFADFYWGKATIQERSGAGGDSPWEAGNEDRGRRGVGWMY
jgi:hypothetical protein